ncbi:MAG: DEAD/DEAH box helicase family protein [Clostridiales bacterium]|nr:DEAD/DEAH box helicase family protein [Clostridiales bacterium]
MPIVNFTNFRFRGTFRDYQQKVLDNAQKYLRNQSIHIVAAPGSGKTILGLELIRRLGAPALVLSPGVTIRQQWGERFAEGFMAEPARVDEVVSYTLKAPKLITSVTYQALHAAYNKKLSDEIIEGDNEGQLEHAETEDYAGFDLMKAVRRAGIKTICLDEAHHLKSEWQKALEGFIAAYKGDITIIALTATPPYDSTAAEWNRYISLCGEIDAEIFIPQLVKQKTLCPHQDYIYFSYPTREERELLAGFQRRAQECVDSILQGEAFKSAINRSRILQDYTNMEETLFDAPDAFAALLVLCARAKLAVPPRLVAMLSPRGQKAYNLETAQTALALLLRMPELFGAREVEEIRGALHRQGLMNGSLPCLTGDRKIKKMLSNSMGKLSAIDEIVRAEYADLGEGLRMLILTDFIKKETLPIVGTDAVIGVMGTVPIFEAVRRSVGDRARIALLSGTLVIVPNGIVNDVRAIAARQGCEMRTKALPNAPYAELTIGSSNKHKVAVLTEALQAGFIQILIGTKSLLGEGWDSPCINSLILASFVGSFMLSNQMRGRAIRTDRNDPKKTANIWHLVTLEPGADSGNIISDDYTTLTRRFDGFLAPSYNGGTIESGIERIDIVKPPYNEAGFANINAETLRLAAAREDMTKSWDKLLGQYARPQVSDSCELPKALRPKGFLAENLMAVLLWSTLAFALTRLLLILPIFGETAIAKVLAGLVCGIAAIFVLIGLRKILQFISPQKTVQTLANCLLRAMQAQGLLESGAARLTMRKSADGYVYCLLKDASARDNELFSKSVAELLSAIDNPRYVIIQKKKLGGLSYINSYACPACLGTKKENAQALAAQLKKQAGGFELIYTRTAEGRKQLVRCKQRSYLNANEIALKRMKMVN